MNEIKTINPTTEEVINNYQLMNKNEIDHILNEMKKSQHQWAMISIEKRQDCLHNAAKILRQDKEKFATIITTEMGKPITQAIAEIEKCAKLCDYYADHGSQFLKPEFIQTEFHKSYRSFHPTGIIFAIMPWNFPFWQVMRFAIPNLMLGNGAVLKHAHNSIGAGFAIEEMFKQAEFPANLFRSLIIDVDLVPFVIHHHSVKGVTLTGSSRAGRVVAKEAGDALKKVVLELGGSDPYVILEDADLEAAAEQCVLSRFNNCGQVCIAAKRIIVVDKVKSTFENLVIEKAKKYVAGNPLDQQTMLGPMARADLRKKIHEQVQRSIASGARCVLGGNLPEGKGYYYPATILFDVTTESPAFHEELFGPVICVTGAKNEEHALNLANDTEYGLAAAVFTRDLDKGEKLANDFLIAGTCAVNTLVASDPRLPFGGTKQSGYGRELAMEGMHEFANIKTIIVK